MTDAAIHRVSGDADNLSLRFLVHSGSPRAFSPRDDNVWGNGSVRFDLQHPLSLRERKEVTDAAIHFHLKIDYRMEPV